jgi:MFS family permease
MTLSGAMPALRYRNFRIFFAGQSLSLLGTWMQTVANSWLVYRLTGSATLLGITAAAQQLPFLLVSPLAGVMAERSNRQRLLLITQVVALAQVLTLAALTFSHTVQVSHVIALSLLMGVMAAIEAPTRQSFLLELVQGREALPNAIALQSMMYQAARFVGPSLAGLVLAFWGEAWCYTVNALTYIGIIVVYCLLRPELSRRARRTSRWSEDLVDGFRYAYGYIGIRRLLLMLGMLGLFSAPWSSLMPIFAAETYAGNSGTLGMLISAMGMGAVCATTYLAFRSSVRGLGTLLCFTGVIAGVALCLFALSSLLWLSLLLLAVFGFGLVASVASINTLLQTIADDDQRSRVLGLYAMTFLGLGPFGNFIAGALADRIGAHETLLGCGVIIVLSTLVFASGRKSWIKSVRPALQRNGTIE